MKRTMKHLSGWILSFILGFQLLSFQSAEAGNLLAPYDLEHTTVLPPGIRSPRFRMILTGVDQKYNNTGTPTPLGAALNRGVSWDDVIAAQNTKVDQDLVRAVLKDAGIPLGSGPGDSTAEVNTFFNVKVPVLSMGITKRFTLAVAMPIYTTQVRAGTGFVASPQGQEFIRSLNVDRDDPLKAAEVGAKFNNIINTKLEDLGYERIQDEDFTDIGDIKVVGKYQFYRSSKHAFAFKPVLTVPTGTTPNADKLVDLPTGDGQIDFGGNVIYDHFLSSRFRINAFGGYTHQFSDQLVRRIPTERGSPLSADKELLDRKLGNQMQMGTSLNYGSGLGGFSAGLGYSYQYMSPTKFEGKAFSQERYRWLEELYPEQSIHAATAMIGYSTVQFYRDGTFFYPFQATLSYSKPIAGTNTSTADVISGEVVLFF